MRAFCNAEATNMLFSEGRSGHWWNVLIRYWVQLAVTKMCLNLLEARKYLIHRKMTGLNKTFGNAW